MNKNIKLSIVVPSYNESLDLKKFGIDRMNEYLKEQDYSYEVLIIDDESTNDTADKIEEYIKDKRNFKFIRNQHGGKGLTVMSGMLKAQGEIALFTDMDQATPIKEIAEFFPKFEEGYDIVIGSRKGRKGAPFVRKLSAWGFALIRNLVLGLPFKDTQCGFKAFTKKAREDIFFKMHQEWSKNISKGAAVNAGFDIEMLFLARKKDYKIAEIEVEWRHVDVGSKHVPVVKEAINAIKDMFKIRLNELQGRYS